MPPQFGHVNCELAAHLSESAADTNVDGRRYVTMSVNVIRSNRCWVGKLLKRNVGFVIFYVCRLCNNSCRIEAA